MSARPMVCLPILFALGCSSTPQKKTCVYEKTGEVIEYSSASDGRSWLERHHFIGDGMALTGLGISYLAAGMVRD